MQVEGGLLDIHLPCGELLSNTKGETLLYFKLPSGTMTLLSAHNLPRCGLESPFESMTVTGLMRAQIHCYCVVVLTEKALLKLISLQSVSQFFAVYMTIGTSQKD
jgi:hypothetical protein